jgi:hypothetical protein
MQSFGLTSFLPLPRMTRNWQSLFFPAVLILAAALPCHAQDTKPPVPQFKFDAGVSGFYQVTQATNGNFIRDDTTESGGALITVRQPYRPWLGWEANVGYTKFYDAYNKGVVKLESNVTDVTISYLFQAPTVYGVQPYASIGGGITVFSPIAGTLTNSLSSQTSLPSQLLPEFTYNIGVNVPVAINASIFSRLGLRGGMRTLMYKTPDFHQQYINNERVRTTFEPYIGVYFRF